MRGDHATIFVKISFASSVENVRFRIVESSEAKACIYYRVISSICWESGTVPFLFHFWWLQTSDEDFNFGPFRNPLRRQQAQACRYIFDNQGNPVWDCGDDNPQGGCWWDVDHNGNSVWT
jgi:hypothetical protein